jgi:O-acetylhomoserine (thiol)-lyase
MGKADGRMKLETLAIHAGYDGDPATKAVAVPIYQTVAFEFDSAEHGAALFNLEVEGNLRAELMGSASVREWRRSSIR